MVPNLPKYTFQSSTRRKWYSWKSNAFFGITMTKTLSIGQSAGCIMLLLTGEIAVHTAPHMTDYTFLQCDGPHRSGISSSIYNECYMTSDV